MQPAITDQRKHGAVNEATHCPVAVKSALPRPETVPQRRAALRFGIVQVALCAALWAATEMDASATSPCYEWRYAQGGFDSGWLSSQNAVFEAMVAGCQQGQCGIGDRTMCTSVVIGQNIVQTPWPFPYDKRTHLIYESTCINPAYPNNPPQTVIEQTDSQQPSVRTNPNGCQVYVSASLPPNAQCGPTCNGVGDPINPASGSVYSSELDLNGGGGTLEFRRFYNSRDAEGGALGVGWRHSFDRHIKPRYAGTNYRPYEVKPDNSSLYATEASACIDGFQDIKARVANWATASATYSNGVCTLISGTTKIGTLPLFYSSPPTPDPSTLVLVGFDVVRDDGQLISFQIQDGIISPPPGNRWKFEQTASGYTLVNENDAVESYDANGKLLSITTRAGITRTMGYDTSGRLITVTDSFGHGLVLTYDSQGRLSTVTRQ